MRVAQKELKETKLFRKKVHFMAALEHLKFVYIDFKVAKTHNILSLAVIAAQYCTHTGGQLF